MIARAILAFILLPLSCLFATDTPLRLGHFPGPSDRFKTTDAVSEILGPMPVLAVPANAPPTGPLVLEFEFFCIGGVPAFHVLPGPPFQSATARKLPAIPHSEAWSLYRARINPEKSPLPLGWKNLRLDLPLPADRRLQIRNARLRPERPGEFEKTSGHSIELAALESYLDSKPDSSINSIRIETAEIRIQGKAGPLRDHLFLAEIPMERLLTDPNRFQEFFPTSPDASGRFKVTIPRKRSADGYDRLLSRWQLVRVMNRAVKPLSHARYAEDITPRSPHLPPARPANQKGLGGWTIDRLPNELKELGITAVTVNLIVHSLLAPAPGPGISHIRWQGETYHVRDAAIAKFDKTFKEAARHNAMVSAILLIANPAKSKDPLLKVLGHPDAVPEGTYGMPNVTSTEGIRLYGAIMNFMAERWSREDGQYGRVHHWIIHNEVDAGWVWTNIGEKPAVVYMDIYQRSMRLTDLIVRQYDPHARPFITLTHHWAEAGNPRWYGSKNMTDLLVRFCQIEGDFPWAMAYHPYPQNLFNPRTWEDDQATFSFDTRKITPKNLEVLDAYMKQPHLRYRGEVRPVHLSENGFNSKDYSGKQLEDQAAGMAMEWKKMQALSSIESWQYHNWIDNRQEGGLRIGLRKFPDEPGDPMGKKPIWHLYKALGTPDEDEACAPYLQTIGIESWEEVIHTAPIR